MSFRDDKNKYGRRDYEEEKDERKMKADHWKNKQESKKKDKGRDKYWGYDEGGWEDN